MADFNMFNKVPHNVVVPEFGPEREAPIYPQITRRYYCQEDVANGTNLWDRLTWNIQQPDQSMVWSSVKLVMPMEIMVYDVQNHSLDMRVASGGPACNMALSESPMNCFRQTTMSINGKTFMEDNIWRRTLNTCYRGVGPQAYGDNHSLKPIVNRDLRDNDQYTHPVTDINGDRIGSVILQRPSMLETAYSLLEHNSPFIERARLWQDHLSGDGTRWAGDITSYLELGPFQARARKSNTAVPYINDFLLQMQFDSNPSRFDSELRVANVVSGYDPEAMEGRVIPCKLLEFGTIPNMLHPGETITTRERWPAKFLCTWQKKPYLEITYVKFPKMQPYYNLRCFEHQYEYGNDFVLLPDDANEFDIEYSKQRVTSHLLSYPTKIYLWADHSRAFQGSFISGGVRRSCELKDIHCRINQRPEVISAPSQEACYEMFQRHTNSSLEFGAWSKSPIYCFDPVDLGQSDMLSNDARRITMEWDCDVGLTPLQVQEYNDTADANNLRWAGYEIPVVESLTSAGSLPQLHMPVICAFDALYGPEVGIDADDFYLQFRTQGATANNRSDDDRLLNWDLYNGGARILLGHEFIINESTTAGQSGHDIDPTFTESFVVRSIRDAYHTIDGCLWGRLHVVPGQSGKTHGENTYDFVGDLFYVPKSAAFRSSQSAHLHNTYLPWSSVEQIEGADDGNGEKVMQYRVKADQYGTIPNPVFRFALGASAGKWFNLTGPGSGTNCCPGPVAWMTDRNGLRNDDTTPIGKRNMMEAGEKVYKPCDQSKADADLWIPILPTDAMCVPPPTASNKFVVWRGAESPGQAGKHVHRWEDNRTGQTVHVLAQVGRAEQPHETKADQPNDIAITANAGGYLEGRPIDFVQGMECSFYNAAANATIASVIPQYSMKVLYEFGNAQYQFTQDGMPTRVLPNLIPVRDSPLIPNL